MHILIIDNDLRWVNFMSKILEVEGHHVKTITDNIKLHWNEEMSKFDLIFYDSKAFKEDQKALGKLIIDRIFDRVIVTAALPNYKDAMFAKRHGAIDYINKAYDYDEIVEIIDTNINKVPISREYLKERLEEEKCL
ncbi:MAG: hypothetical protein PVH61_29695 [Candidatus Aminicenantes bacterium]|jgi:DNA-binding NtrC family response regulator